MRRERRSNAIAPFPPSATRIMPPIDRRHGFIRGWNVTGTSAWDGAQLRNVLDKNNTGSTVWADTGYRSKKNEPWLEKNGYVSDIHHKKPKGRPMSQATSRANGRRSKTRAFVEHVFAQQKSRMACLSARSASPAPASRSAWPTSPTISPASFGTRAELRSHDGGSGGKRRRDAEIGNQHQPQRPNSSHRRASGCSQPHCRTTPPLLEMPVVRGVQLRSVCRVYQEG